MTNILNHQPSVSVDLHYPLDNAKLNPLNSNPRPRQRALAYGSFKVHVLKSRFSCSNSGIMPYDQGLSTFVITGNRSKKEGIDVLEYLENTLKICIIDVMIG